MITKNGARLLGLIPTPIRNYLSKRLVKGYLRKYAEIHAEGLENLKEITRPTIFVCNHLSNSDALVLNEILQEEDPTFVAGVKLSGNEVTTVGVQIIKTTTIKPDSSDIEGLKRIMKLITGGESILLFPEGTRSRTGQMGKARRGILLMAKMTGAPIVPIGIWGTEILLPINQEGAMEKETFHHAKVFLKIGTQFQLPAMEKGYEKRLYEEETLGLIMGRIAELLPEEYRGEYR